MDQNVKKSNQESIPDAVDVVSLNNVDNLDIEELERRLELAPLLEPGCGVNWLS